ncbi:MAG: YggS family pyridoxal phosphate-dependent enzyme [Clostridia bacterium]|nr:YggS family pyridoxal phosphate-dependent enzyme [Clostridia bacterium]MDD4798834.1 YggS family pyridoxal phosphate-dependent enzyme [Clostridia bacterium]
MKTAEEIRLALSEIAKTIEEAKKSPRAAAEVLMLAVTKTRTVEEIRAAVEAGYLELGENRVQELCDKYPQIAGVRWHLIGALQTNKVKYIIDKVALIHSLDRLELAAEIDRQAAKHQLVMPCLIQLNLAKEETKAGLYREDLADFIKELAKYKNLRVEGLMTIGPPEEDPEAARPLFAELRALRDELAQQAYPHIKMKHLSMGMSHDYRVAIEEGATIVRIGSTIFGPRPPYKNA